jgi:hypothetical protein
VQTSACASKEADIVQLKAQISSALGDSETAVRIAQQQLLGTKQVFLSLQRRIHDDLGLGSSVALAPPGSGAEVVAERVLDVVRSRVAALQEEKMDLARRLKDASLSLATAKAEGIAAVDEAVSTQRAAAAEELQRQTEAAAATEAQCLAAVEAQKTEVEALQRERDSWQAAREKVRELLSRRLRLCLE